MQNMITFIFTVYNYVIHIANCIMTLTQNSVHETLKCGWSIAETERHPAVLEETPWSCNSCLLFVFGRDWNLMEPTLHIEYGENLSLYELQYVINSLGGVGILASDAIDGTIIGTYTEFSRLLSDDNEWRCVWTGRRLNHFVVQQLYEHLLHVIVECDWQWIGTRLTGLLHKDNVMLDASE